MIALSGPSEKAIRAQIAESVSLIAELDFPERWPDLINVRQKSSPVFISFLNSHTTIATCSIPQRRRFQYQPWRTGNSTLNLPLMALPSALGRVLVHHQTGPLKVPRPVLQTLPVDHFAPSCFPGSTDCTDYGRTCGVVLRSHLPRSCSRIRRWP